MKAWVIVLLALVTLIFGLAGVVFGSYVSANNTSARYEANIEKFNEDSQNVLSAYTLKIKEMAQVPDMYTDALKEMISATFQGRYGENGSQATFQWIQEQNLPVDASLFTNLQAAMEAGRDEFRLSQTKKIDVCNDYKYYQKLFWSGMFVRAAGFPSPTISDSCKVILDTQTSNTFKTGIAEVISIK